MYSNVTTSKWEIPNILPSVLDCCCKKPIAKENSAVCCYPDVSTVAADAGVRILAKRCTWMGLFTHSVLNIPCQDYNQHMCRHRMVIISISDLCFTIVPVFQQRKEQRWAEAPRLFRDRRFDVVFQIEAPLGIIQLRPAEEQSQVKLATCSACLFEVTEVGTFAGNW